MDLYEGEMGIRPRRQGDLLGRPSSLRRVMGVSEVA